MRLEELAAVGRKMLGLHPKEYTIEIDWSPVRGSMYPYAWRVVWDKTGDVVSNGRGRSLAESKIYAKNAVKVHRRKRAAPVQPKRWQYRA